MKRKSTILKKERPHVVAVVTSESELALAQQGQWPVDLFEIRLDLFPAPDPLPILPKPLLLTARCREEGGKALSAEEQLTLLSAHASNKNVAAIDLEIATLKRSTEALRFASDAIDAGLIVIGSFHDFETTPADSRLAEIAQLARELPIDLLKIAATTANLEDLARLATFQEEEGANMPVATMGMGQLGKPSRLLLAGLGSRLSYGFIEEAAAPGQWAAKELRAALSL